MVNAYHNNHPYRHQAVMIAGIAALFLIICQIFPSQVTANTVFVPIRVVGCDGVGKGGLQVALWGCVDYLAFEGNKPRAENISQGIITTTASDGWINYPAGLTNGYPNSPPAALGDCAAHGIPTEYCYGSAGYKCQVAVYDPSTNAADPRYTQTELFPTGVNGAVQTLYEYAMSHVAKCTSNGGLGCGESGCAQSEECYPTAVVLRPVVSSCSPQCPAIPPTSARACGNTGYGFMCPAYDIKVDLAPTYPVSISFRNAASQPPFTVSDPLLDGVDFNGGTNKWGWMLQWPLSYLDTPVTGVVLAGQYIPAGSVTARVTKLAGTTYKLDFVYDVSSSGSTMDRIHVYFECMVMSTLAPGKYTFQKSFRPTVSRYDSVADNTSPQATCGPNARYLYVSFHTALTACLT